MTRLRRAMLVLVVASFTLGGCSSMKLNDVVSESPTFDFHAYFNGHTRASGWFSDRFGKPRRHFCGDFLGTVEGDELVLDEALYYTDGVIDERVWRVSISDDGEFTARAESLVGEARGRIIGNGLQMQYTMRLAMADGSEGTFDFNDFMLLQPDGSLHNITQVKKWGVRLGTVSTQYARHDGSQTCDSRSPP